MGRSRRDAALWARVARRGGTDPSLSGDDAEYLNVDGSGNLLTAASVHTPVRQRTGLSYFASADGGRMAYNATTNFQTITTGEQPLAAFRNPTGSGIDVLLWYGEFASTLDTSFRRYRGGTVTENVNATAQDVANMGGGTRPASARLLLPSQYTASGGVVSKTALIQSYGYYPAEVQFGVRIRPGQAIRWTISGPLSGSQQNLMASIYLEWAEVTAE